jgi:hypothetical protein
LPVSLTTGKSSSFTCDFGKTGDVYRYFEFPAPGYQAILDAESRGRFFLAHIRDCFPYERTAKLHAA